MFFPPSSKSRRAVPIRGPVAHPEPPPVAPPVAHPEPPPEPIGSSKPPSEESEWPDVPDLSGLGGGSDPSGPASGSGTVNDDDDDDDAPLHIGVDTRPAFDFQGGAGGRSLHAVAYGSGGGNVSTVPAGEPFEGRNMGGGTRDGVYGSSIYGSGFPGMPGHGHGVAHAPFPYYFWPVSWGSNVHSEPAYLHTDEFGAPDNTTRPGGAQQQLTVVAPLPGTAIYHVVADSSTIKVLAETLTDGCGKEIRNQPLEATPFTGGASDPQPESAIQYYRASTVALTLDGYDNSVAVANGTADAPLPADLDKTFLKCVNETIGKSVPLVEAPRTLTTSPTPTPLPTNDAAALAAPVWLLLCLMLALRTAF